MASQKRHQYTYLQGGDHAEIRLLILHPYRSNPDSALFGSLKKVPYADPPPYEALSYAWGGNDQKERLYISDTLGTTNESWSLWLKTFINPWQQMPSSEIGQFLECDYIPITPNLQSALKRLRRKTVERILWVDQLSINQDEQSCAAMRAYNQEEIAHRKQGHSEFSSLKSGGRSLEAFLQILGRDTDLNTYNWQAFNSFYNRPWFGRLWIIQEIAFSKEVVILCGSRTTTMPWATVDQNVMSSHAEYHQLLPYPIGFLNCFTIATIRDRIWIRSADPGRLASSLGLRPEDLPPGKDFDPIDIIAYTKTFECCDPKDRFFALYGLLKSMFGWSKEPNYSMTVKEVYLDMTRLLIKRDKSLRILSGNLLRHDDLDWPSWVPDWSVRDSLDRCCNGLHTLSSEFCASGTRSITVNESGDIRFPNEYSISIRGLEFDTCSTVLEVFEFNQRTYPNQNGTLTQWINHILQKNTSKEDASTIAFRTLIANGFGTKRTDESYVTNRRSTWLEWTRSITCNYLPDQSPQIPPLTQNKKVQIDSALQLEQHTRAYDFAVRSACRGRRLVVTSRGFVGVCPRGTQAGDVVSILCGGKAPSVLRKHGKFYRLIGEFYLDGIMYGEVFEEGFKSQGPLFERSSDTQVDDSTQDKGSEGSGKANLGTNTHLKARGSKHEMIYFEIR